MAVAFSEQERQTILKSLKETARQCALSLGVHKTSVDQLARAANISKGAFYKFYASKEMLFLEVLEDMLTEVYEVSFRILEQNCGLSDAARVAEAVLAACRAMEQTGMMDFMERDVPCILRKIPREMQKKHYHSDAVHIREALSRAGLEPVGGIELASAAIRGLMLTVSHRENIGEQYPQVLEILVRGTCDRLFPPK